MAREGQVRKLSPDFLAEPNAGSNIKKVVAVMSGKGGVGKSTVTALLAAAATRAGYKVGVLDADLTGPSIPRMFGVTARPQSGPNGLVPPVSRGGVAVMSINLLLEHEDQPVIWRGPLVAGTVKQFWSEVSWGELDFLFVDMPPGTSDVPLTVMQSLPLDGVVLVTSPQDLVFMVVRKALQMAKTMEVRILGLVENMSYVICPDCRRRIDVFGPGQSGQAALEADLTFWGSMPFDPKLAKFGDEGSIEQYESELMTKMAQGLAAQLK